MDSERRAEVESIIQGMNDQEAAESLRIFAAGDAAFIQKVHEKVQGVLLGSSKKALLDLIHGRNEDFVDSLIDANCQDLAQFFFEMEPERVADVMRIIEGMTGEEAAESLRIIVAERGLEFLQNALPRIQERMGGSEKKALLVLISLDRDRIFRFMGEVGITSYAPILDICRNLSDADLDKALSVYQSFPEDLVRSMMGYQKVQYLKAYAKNPAIVGNPSVIRGINLLLGQDGDFVDFLELLEICTAFKPEEIEGVLQYAGTLLGFTNASISDVSRILNSFRLASMRGIDPSVFVVWAEQVLTTLFGQIDSDAMADEVERLAALEAAGSEDIRSLRGTDCSHLWEGWDAASAIPTEDLSRFINLLPAHLWNRMATGQFQALLNGFHKLNQAGRNRVLNVWYAYTDHESLRLTIEDARRMGELQDREPDVHAGNRDRKTHDALEKLWANTGGVSPTEIQAAYTGFLGYLAQDYRDEVSREIDRLDAQALRTRLGLIGAAMSESRMKARLKAEIPGQVNKIIYALNGPRDPNDWGALTIGWTIWSEGRRWDIEGEEFLARLWRFSESLTEPDRSAAKRGIASALLDSYTDSHSMVRVCNPGKAQRLCVSVLQGRLAGVSIDAVARTRPTMERSIEVFFQQPWIQGIKGAKVLKIAARRFCYENSDVDREPFLQEVDRLAEAL